MRKLGSHGRLNLIVFFCVLAPLAVALGTGFRAIIHISQLPQEKLDSLRVEEVTTQGRMLTENLWSSTDSIRSRAFAIYQSLSRNQKPSMLPEGPILFLSQMEMDESGKWNIIQTLKKPGFSPGEVFEQGTVKALSENTNLLDTQRRGVGLVRIPRIEGERNAPLALTFPLGTRGVLVAIVYPMDAFPVFEKWRTHSEGGLLRAYLVGKDGLFLAHSVPSYVGSKMDALSLYRQSLQPLFAGERLSGAGTYPAIDHHQTTLSYMRFGQMDLGVVVEKVRTGDGVSLPWLELVAAGLLSTGIALLLAYGLSAWVARQIFAIPQRTAKRPIESPKQSSSAAAWIQPQKQGVNTPSAWTGSQKDLESELPVIDGASGKRKYDPSLNQ